MAESGPGPTVHEDPVLFRESLTFTASESGFSARLIEQDYYCSLILHDLVPLFEQGLVFRGGTCLNKVHAGFYRLSEDLDFIVSVPVDSTPSQRRALVRPIGEHLADRSGRPSPFRVAEPLSGHNVSRQYIGRYSYRSVITGEARMVKLEVSLREPIVLPVANLPAQTMLRNPFTNAAAVAGVPVSVLARDEAYAEKIRAALTRRDPAVRDFYDVDHAVKTGRLDTESPKLVDLVRTKVAVHGNEHVDVSGGRLAELKRQLEAQLKPVLRPDDFERFDLRDSFARMVSIAAAIRG